MSTRVECKKSLFSKNIELVIVKAFEKISGRALSPRELIIDLIEFETVVWL